MVEWQAEKLMKDAAMNKKDAFTQMMYELEDLQLGMRDEWLQDSLPLEWDGMEYGSPSPRAKTRVTIRIDSDMLRWFRKMGPGYGPRMNQILRIYWTALLGGGIKGYPDDNNIPRLLNRGNARMREMYKDFP
ncbi:hypothetical protein A8B74_10045 [Sulfitobacter geojensis]|nr:hypothetical protein A8B74_10045 [Sulfitobacter geojensis]